MPTFGFASAFDRHPQLWARCRSDVADAMVAEGWNRHARKFLEVQARRARRLFSARLP